MRTYLKDLAARRETLVAQSAAQRALAGQTTAGIRRTLVSVERSVKLLRQLARKPAVLGLCAVAVALLIAKPRQTLAWLGHGLTAYNILRRARRTLLSEASSWTASSGPP